MASPKKSHTTTVGTIDEEVLAFTAGDDLIRDRELVEWDCLGTAAHVTMLSRMRVKPRLFSVAERKQVIAALSEIIEKHRAGTFSLKLEDQDVHLAVERQLTSELGDLGRKVHTGRSRNDQVALDLRLYGRDMLMHLIADCADLAQALLRLGKKHAAQPMVGRTHMQPAMPSSVGLWATAWVEGLLDDAILLLSVLELNDFCPLGSAAGYGVPLPIDPALTASLLGFGRPCTNAIHAGNARGKLEGVILDACSQTLLTLSRLSQDLMLFTMPEFGYFSLPEEFTTGSSIMPQKRNPDVLELMRARVVQVRTLASQIYHTVCGLPSGYNRDLQDSKGAFMEGLHTTRSCLRIMSRMVSGLKVHGKVMDAAFGADVYATDAALERVAAGEPFRDAYHYIKGHLDELAVRDPYEAIARKTHLGGTAGIDFEALQERIKTLRQTARDEQKAVSKALSKLMQNPASGR